MRCEAESHVERTDVQVERTDLHVERTDVDHPAWWIGFDCAHVGDTPNLDFITDPEAREFYRMSRWESLDDGVFRDIDYVRTECFNIIIQAIAAPGQASPGDLGDGPESD